jgi:lipopolysaccharide transport system permease protein
MFRRVWSHRDLVLTLVRRQYQLRYRQSAVGVAWAIIPPVATLAVGTLVFHRVAGVESVGAPYPVFTMSGLVLWTFFASSLITGIPSVVGALPMVTRFPFPKAALPLSMIGLSFLDLVVSVVLFALIVVAYDVGLSWTALWLPILVLIEAVLVAGLVLLLSAINMFARDIKLGIPLLIQAWLLLTPVLYPLNSVPQDLRVLYTANPMTGLVENAHRVLVYGLSLDLGLLLPSLIGAVIAALWGWWYFGATENRFADVI